MSRWQDDLIWLLDNVFPGRGGVTDLAKALRAYSNHVQRGAVYQWLYGNNTPNSENQRALRLLREAHEKARAN